MKRSGPLKLVIMATAGVSLAACDKFEEKADGQVFVDQEQCVSAEQYSVNECTAAFKVAKDADNASAPRYNTNRLCEDQHGRYACVPAYGTGTSYSSYFVPIAAGYFIANAAQGLSDWKYRVRPVYPDRNRRHFYTSGGYLLDMSSSNRSARIPKKATAKLPKPPKVQTRTSIASRGGFGSRSGRGFGG
ncbi:MULTISPECIES: DUF1190 domain-containing protein [unclassified Pseudovibrio]|uniref:DUF1190 domain-containing protein n=1 Tax=unclassified Pseudovibrio TaxID=2627060 RepID=UPI0007B302CC|nr:MULTISPECIES: DUF1190 domain-containing protein [unclassified Pseudovibrio]KZK92446.1 hypothetical protein PsW74_05729 [Pseudovibrio sp. W74]KZL08659.1 hypothetical protein PsAD14_02980 [Pseudovibrio sp. Ad14]